MSELIILDVRTPEEVAAGYLEGALFADFNGADFVGEIAALDRAANYVLYCRSGGRVSNAIPLMQSLGFTGELVNLGGLEDAATATGIAIVQ
jgi:rhodanese-related sulfurtransferase